MATPTYPLTRFTPSATCGIASPTHLYAVHKTCYMHGASTLLLNPSFLPCTAIQAGEPPDRGNPDCYADWAWARLSTSQYSTCPVGYTAASTLSYHPFYRSVGQPATDVVARVVFCCPSAPADDGEGRGYVYTPDGEPNNARKMVVDGVTFAGEAYLMPRCRGFLGPGVRTLTAYSDTMAWAKREEQTAVMLTETWKAGREVWAGGESFSYTRFGDGHTCFGNCTGYWSGGYTSPSVLVPEVMVPETQTERVTRETGGLRTGTGEGVGTGVAQTRSGSGSGPTETVTGGVGRRAIKIRLMVGLAATVISLLVT